jgi:PKD repeat protein
MARLIRYLPVCLGLITALALTGCPLQGNGVVTLSVSPEILDLGATATEGVITVQNTSPSRMAPLVVLPSASWLEVKNCTDTADGCVQNGLMGSIRIRISADRAKTVLGINRSTLTLVSEGATNQTVEVILQDLLMPDYRVSDSTPNVGQVVQFSDESLVEEGYGPVTGWRWDFGDGNTSTARNPQHIYTVGGAYDVSLTMSAGIRSETLRRTGFVVVGGNGAPTASFTVSPEEAFVSTPVTFSDRSTSTAGNITAWEWDFGDGASATGPEVTHTYATPGTYTVTLTVRTAGASGSTSRTLLVRSRIAPTAQFGVTPNDPVIGKPAHFSDASTAGSAPITSWQWDFGDGQTSTSQNPTHTYAAMGSYSVSLTITTAHGTATAARTIEVVPPAPVASFIAEPTEAATGEGVQFRDQSTSEAGTITSWAWNFGDGTTSADQNPLHRYQQEGIYTVTLTVRTREARNNTNTLVRRDYIRVDDGGNATGNALRDFVHRKDPNTSVRFTRTYDLTGAFMHVVRLQSQAWRSPAEIADGLIWDHWLTIYEPDIMKYDTALLFIDGGSRRPDSPPTPTSEEEFFIQFAIATGTVVVHLPNVPSQPITFTEEVGIRENRTEDSIIAYSYDEFAKTFVNGAPDNDWPLLFPMTKAAVEAMNAVQQVLPQVTNKVPADAQVNDFVVAGASKRGWTTWLTGAADMRVKAIIPIVIDVLNMEEQILHHRRSYGYYSPAIYPYAQEQVFDRFDTPEGQALLKLVDPYEYRRDLRMPKFVLNSTGDQFFLPDSSRFYFADMLGEKHVSYVPNTDHSLDNSTSVLDTSSALSSVLAFYMAVTQDVPRPQVTWDFPENDTSIIATASETPLQVVLWWNYNEVSRDFREETLNNPSDPDSPQRPWIPFTPGDGTGFIRALGNNRYEGRPPLVPGAWNGYFIQMFFANGAEVVTPLPDIGQTPPFTMSTAVRVTPDTYPPFPAEEFLAFGGSTESQQFIDVIFLHGTPRRMGQEFGRVRAEEINEFIPRYVNAAVSENPRITFQTLSDTWRHFTEGPNRLLDTRIVEEIEGIAEGAEIGVEWLQWANMVPILESYPGHAAAFWNPAGLGINAAFGQHQNLERITQSAPVITIYVPDKGMPHALMTYAGLVMAPVGVNLAGIAPMSVGRIANTYAPGASHYLPMLRRILYDTTSLRDAIALVEQTPLNMQMQFVIADGRFERRAAKLVVNSVGIATTYLDNAALDPLAPNIAPGLVYTEPSAFGLYTDNYGFLTSFGGVLQELNDEVSESIGPITVNDVTYDNIQNVVIDTVQLLLYTSYSQIPRNETFFAPAYTQPYAEFNFQAIMP